MDKDPKHKAKPRRLLSLDILRGITIAGMILVNNPGSWGDAYMPLRHAEWNGLTPTDLVFPFFMFIMGVSTYMSLRKYEFKFTWASFAKIIRRTVVIFAIGLALAWFGLFMRGMLSGKTFSDAVFNFDRIRFFGVMPRLALCYGIGSTLALLIPRKALPWTVGALLAGYSLLLLLGNGFAYSDTNVLYIVDNKLFGPNHLYADFIDGVKLHFDPEGLLSTIPSVAHVLIGFLCGGLIMGTTDNEKRIVRLFIVGTILTFAGFLLDYGMPINKKIWSPTFVLTTCGLASSFLALLIWIIDIKGYKRWCRFFEVFGINPLFLFCLATVLSIIIGTVQLPWSGAESGMATIKTIVYKGFIMPICGSDKAFASLIFSLAFILVNWGVGLILYRKKIYIKI